MNMESAAVEDDDDVMAAMAMAGGVGSLDEANFNFTDDVADNGIFDETRVNFTALYTTGNLTLEIFPYCGADGELDVMVRFVIAVHLT